MRYGSHLSTKQTVQTEEVLGKDQVKNDEGGYVFGITPEQAFLRFLILGTQGGTFYASEKKSTLDNCKSAIPFIKTNGLRAVELIVDVSEHGRAPKNDSAIFALALVCTHGDAEAKRVAYAAITKVCRIGTHLFQFCQAIQDLRGWSRGLRTGVSKFYLGDVDKLAYQMVKYQQRDGWTHRDVLRLSHPKITINWGPEAVSRASLFRWAVGKEALMGHLPPKLVLAYIEATTASTGRVCELIKEHNLSWEMLPTEKLGEVIVWQTLLPKLPLTALMRNLGRLTNLNILSQPEWNKLVVAKLTDQAALKKARLHPLSLLTALKTYSSGHGNKGSLTWAPVPKIIDALDEAVQLSFGMIEPTGKRFLLGVDVSGSMAGSMISGSPLSAREGAAAMALATARTEEDYGIMAFSGNFIELPLTKKSTFNDAIKITSGLDYDTTDCSLPVLYAMKHKLVVDCFCIYTDSETYAGRHPFQALQLYRKETGIQAKMIVVGMTSNNFTIADPSDPNMLDVCGFDTTTPQVISEFAKL